MQNIAGGEKLRTKIRRVFPISANFTFGGLSDKKTQYPPLSKHLYCTRDLIYIKPSGLYKVNVNFTIQCRKLKIIKVE